LFPWALSKAIHVAEHDHQFVDWLLKTDFIISWILRPLSPTSRRDGETDERNAFADGDYPR
jgi:hypothetical protein